MKFIKEDNMSFLNEMANYVPDVKKVIKEEYDYESDEDGTILVKKGNDEIVDMMILDIDGEMLELSEADPENSVAIITNMYSNRKAKEEFITHLERLGFAQVEDNSLENMTSELEDEIED